MSEERMLGCICQCKDTNFKANHNQSRNGAASYAVVFANAKILILKLITTINYTYFEKFTLYLPMQRY